MTERTWTLDVLDEGLRLLAAFSGPFAAGMCSAMAGRISAAARFLVASPWAAVAVLCGACWA